MPLAYAPECHRLIPLSPRLRSGSHPGIPAPIGFVRHQLTSSVAAFADLALFKTAIDRSRTTVSWNLKLLLHMGSVKWKTPYLVFYMQMPTRTPHDEELPPKQHENKKNS